MATWIRKDGKITPKIERKSENLRVFAISSQKPDVAPARVRESNVRPFRQAQSFQSSVRHYDPRSRKFPIAA